MCVCVGGVETMMLMLGLDIITHVSPPPKKNGLPAAFLERMKLQYHMLMTQIACSSFNCTRGGGRERGLGVGVGGGGACLPFVGVVHKPDHRGNQSDCNRITNSRSAFGDEMMLNGACGAFKVIQENAFLLDEGVCAVSYKLRMHGTTPYCVFFFF